MKKLDRFTIRLTGSNLIMFKEFMKKEPDIDPNNRSGAMNLIIARYFLYEKYSDLINALERMIKKH